MSKTRRPEQQIHLALVEHLRTRARKGLVFWHTPNGGFRSWSEAKIFSGLGVLPGVPDLLMLHKRQLYGLELKRPKAKPTSNQIATIAALEAAGCICAVADSLDSAVEQLECWDLLKGRAQ
jgi:hypothetical protein